MRHSAVFLAMIGLGLGACTLDGAGEEHALGDSGQPVTFEAAADTDPGAAAKPIRFGEVAVATFGCAPFCGAIGTRSEGWYDGCTGRLIRYALCRDAAAFCDRIGTESEGWYWYAREADGNPRLVLIRWETCSVRSEANRTRWFSFTGRAGWPIHLYADGLLERGLPSPLRGLDTEVVLYFKPGDLLPVEPRPVAKNDDGNEEGWVVRQNLAPNKTSSSIRDFRLPSTGTYLVKLTVKDLRQGSVELVVKAPIPTPCSADSDSASVSDPTCAANPVGPDDVSLAEPLGAFVNEHPSPGQIARLELRPDHTYAAAVFVVCVSDPCPPRKSAGVYRLLRTADGRRYLVFRASVGVDVDPHFYRYPGPGGELWLQNLGTPIWYQMVPLLPCDTTKINFTPANEPQYDFYEVCIPRISPRPLEGLLKSVDPSIYCGVAGGFAHCNRETEIGCHAELEFLPGSKRITAGKWRQICAISRFDFVSRIGGGHWVQ
jgi:hypothetical protein